MSEVVLEARGRFWSSELRVEKGHFAPQQSVTGRLRVFANGRSRLELDSTIELSGQEDGVGRILDRSSVNASICGYLVDSRSEPNVWLSELRCDGGILGGGGPNLETFEATRCLVSREPFKPGTELRFRWLDLHLDGFEDWIDRGNILIKKTHRRVTAQASLRSSRTWRLSGMTLELLRYLKGTGGAEVRQVTWREHQLLRLGYVKASLTINQAIDRAGRIEDLLVLLTGCDRRIERVEFRNHRNSSPVRLYYPRDARSAENTARWYHSWVPYNVIASQFGQILSDWLESYETYGPGFHLYMGNRRGHPMYAEHRFASLMWGMETLHRSLHPQGPSGGQAVKVRRILDQIAAPKDRAWAERHLPKSSEPALSQRLAELITALPLDLDRNEINLFAQRCTARRNDISHYGGRREPGSYDTFHQEIVDLSYAVELLYHALLLHLIKIPDKWIRFYFVDGMRSSNVRSILEHSGLTLPPSAAAGSPTG